ncbi:MAG: hypothetical protein GX203_04565 [Acholeplasmataceae bacterium]|nr:hypothetical protein [Acholeplasmataceae bacterium]HPT89383.1 hypothetical protein [Bacilli bacterium]HQA19866.1 hypothetical protein [Bacilli bacterium]
MKKLIVVLLLIFLFNLNANSYSKTGYKNFKEITFYNDGKLLVEMSQSEIDKGFKKVKRKFWGWQTHYFYLNEEASFIGEEIFSRSNRSSTPYEFDYHLKEMTLSERTRKATGSISIKTKGKMSKFDLNLDGELKGEIGSKDSTTVTEETKIKMQIMPNTKLTLRVAGEVYVSNGVACYYVLGITFKKGAWETIDISTLYYELVEENLI